MLLKQRMQYRALDVKFRYCSEQRVSVMNLLIVLSENRRVLPCAQTKAELVTNRAFNVTFVNCTAALWVSRNMMFPGTWRSPQDCHGEKVSSPSTGSTQSCHGPSVFDLQHCLDLY